MPDECTVTLRIHVSIITDVQITFHTFLTPALAGSEDEVILVTKKHTHTISPLRSTEECYQLHAPNTSTP